MQDRTTHPEEGQPASLSPAVALKERRVLSRRMLLGTLGVAATGGALTMVSYRDGAQGATTSGAAPRKTAAAAEHAWCRAMSRHQ